MYVELVIEIPGPVTCDETLSRRLPGRVAVVTVPCNTYASSHHVARVVSALRMLLRVALRTGKAACFVKITLPALPVSSLTDMRVSGIVGEMNAVVRIRCVGVVMAIGPECVMGHVAFSEVWV